MNDNLDVNWDDSAESVVRLDVHDDYTWEEFNMAVGLVSGMVAVKAHRCDILVNLGKASAESSGVSAIQKALGALDILPPNVGLVVIIVPPLAGMLFSAAKRLDSRVSTRAKTASSLDKARAIVAEERQAA